MEGFGALFLIFGIGLILEGIANCHGHRPYIVRAYYVYQHMTLEELKNMGKILISLGIGMAIGSTTGFLYEEESFIPVIAVVVACIISLVINRNINKKNRNNGVKNGKI